MYKDPLNLLLLSLVVNNGFILTWMYYNGLDDVSGLYYLNYPIVFTGHIGISVTGYTTEANFSASTTPNMNIVTRGLYNDHNIDNKSHIGIQRKTKCNVIVLGY